MTKFLILAAAAGLAAVVTIPSAGAQDVDKDAQKASRETTAQRRAQAEVDAAKKLDAEGEEVTYEQVLADPDNVELNYRFARGQVRRGDLKGASATLERILLVNPNLVKIRLFHAIVLFRLEDLVGAQRQFETLLKLDLPAEAKEEVEGYLKTARKRQKRTQLSGRVAIGFEYDSNRNAAPSSNQRLFADIPLTLQGTSNRREDTSWLFMAGLDARRKLGSGRHEVFGSLDLYRAEQSEIETLNLQAVSASAGGTYHTRWADVTPSVQFDHVELAHQTFLRNRGGAVRLERKVSRQASLYTEFRGVYQDFARTAEVPTAPERTGEQYEGSLGGDFLLNPKMKLGVGLGMTKKNARADFNAFERQSLDLRHSWLLGRGTFLFSAFTLNWDKYDEPDPFVSRNLRKDTTFRAGSTFGAPLSLLHSSLKDFVWTATYEYYQAVSTIRNYAYTNNRVSTLLTYRWGVGL